MHDYISGAIEPVHLFSAVVCCTASVFAWLFYICLTHYCMMCYIWNVLYEMLYITIAWYIMRCCTCYPIIRKTNLQHLIILLPHVHCYVAFYSSIIICDYILSVLGGDNPIVSTYWSGHTFLLNFSYCYDKIPLSLIVV